MRRSRRALGLVEAMVGLAILVVALAAATSVLYTGRKDRADWERQVDLVYGLLNGMERIRRDLEVSRMIAFPPASNGPEGRREILVTVDAAARVVVYGVVGDDLVAQVMPEVGQPAPPPRVMIPRVDRVVFHHRSDTLAVRFQVFTGGVSLVATVRAANDLSTEGLDFLDTYGL